MFFLRAVKFWIVVSTLASLAGWTLSAVGMLNRIGYMIFAAFVALAIFLFWKSSLLAPLSPVQEFGKLRRRFRRFLPASFALLAALVFVSGLLYAPTDHTGLSYRVPRVLQWLQHGSWFWIHTPNYRMNDRACGIEWLSAPLLLFLKSDRALFLTNFIPFILMPGLIFSVWTRMGVRPRVAWSWMWLVPTSYSFLMQAGGIANDAFPTVYALAMMDFALRAWSEVRGRRPEVGSRRSAVGGQRSEFRSPSSAAGSLPSDLRPPTSDLWLAVLSAALLVGAKASNLPLGLPWAIVIVPLLAGAFRVSRCRFRFSLAAGFVLFLALVVSFIPTAILNIHYVHDWSGLSIERTGMNMKNPLAGILGNAVLLVMNDFVPTFFPMAHWWNEHALSLLPRGLVHLLDANFEPGYHILGEIPTEDSSGIGFGIGVLLVISVLAGALRKTQNAIRTTRFPAFSKLLLLAPWVSLLAYCVKTGMVTPGRLITPYYPLLFPLLLVGAGQWQMVRRGWWRILAAGVLALALAALIVNPSRPLWPANTILSRAVAKRPGQPQLSRAQKVYEVYGRRSDPSAEVRQWFPPGLKTIGFLGFCDDLDISLWKPYGSRRVEPFLIDDSRETIRKLGIEYAVVSGLELSMEHTTIEQWLQKSGAELIASVTATTTVAMGPQAWYVVHIKP